MVTDSEWSTLASAVWHTDARGINYLWKGTGGVARFAVNTTNKTIRLPDLRGMFLEHYGYGGLSLRGVHGDFMRDIEGNVALIDTWVAAIDNQYTNGPFHSSVGARVRGVGGGNNSEDWRLINFRNDLNTPVAYVNKPRAVGMMLCTYLGGPENL